MATLESPVTWQRSRWNIEARIALSESSSPSISTSDFSQRLFQYCLCSFRRRSYDMEAVSSRICSGAAGLKSRDVVTAERFSMTRVLLGNSDTRKPLRGSSTYSHFASSEIRRQTVVMVSPPVFRARFTLVVTSLFTSLSERRSTSHCSLPPSRDPNSMKWSSPFVRTSVSIPDFIEILTGRSTAVNAARCTLKLGCTPLMNRSKLTFRSPSAVCHIRSRSIKASCMFSFLL